MSRFRTLYMQAVHNAQIKPFTIDLSLQVVKDKRTKKTKGYGFVSFMDSKDFAKALKEMNGKYIGNRPCKLRKSTWDERNPDKRAQKAKEKSLTPEPFL